MAYFVTNSGHMLPERLQDNPPFKDELLEPKVANDLWNEFGLAGDPGLSTTFAFGGPYHAWEDVDGIGHHMRLKGQRRLLTLLYEDRDQGLLEPLRSLSGDDTPPISSRHGKWVLAEDEQGQQGTIDQGETGPTFHYVDRPAKGGFGRYGRAQTRLVGSVKDQQGDNKKDKGTRAGRLRLRIEQMLKESAQKESANEMVAESRVKTTASTRMEYTGGFSVIRNTNFRMREFPIFGDGSSFRDWKVQQASHLQGIATCFYDPEGGWVKYLSDMRRNFDLTHRECRWQWTGDMPLNWGTGPARDVYLGMIEVQRDSLDLVIDLERKMKAARKDRVLWAVHKMKSALTVERAWQGVPHLLRALAEVGELAEGRLALLREAYSRRIAPFLEKRDVIPTAILEWELNTGFKWIPRDDLLLSQLGGFELYGAITDPVDSKLFEKGADDLEMVLSTGTLPGMDMGINFFHYLR